MVTPTLIMVLLLGAALILLAWGAFSILPPVSRRVAKTLWCPFRRRTVTAEFKEEEWGGTCFDVSSCTAFTPPTAITCEKLCLRLDEPPGPKDT